MSTDTDRELSDSERAAVSVARAGYAAFDQEDFEAAVASFRRAVEIWPENGVFWYDIARTLRETGEYGEALEAIGEAIRLNPEEPQFRHARGNIKRSLKDQQGAVEEFRRALELDPKFPAHNNLGLTYHELGELELARDVLEIGLNLTPEDTDILENLSSVVYNLERFAVAAMCDQRLTELAPNRSIGWSRLANDHYRLSRFEQSELAIRRAISLGEATAENYSLLADVLLELGRVGESEQVREDERRAAGQEPTFGSMET